MWIVNISLGLFAFIALGIVLVSLFRLGTVFWLAEKLLDALQKLQCNIETRRQARVDKAAAEANPIPQRVE
jgi:hypothetical protein